MFDLKYILLILLSLSLQLNAEISISKTNEGVYFVLEKVDKENYKNWSTYAGLAEHLSQSITQKLYFVQDVVRKGEDDAAAKVLEKPIGEIDDPHILSLIKNAPNPVETLKKAYNILNSGLDGLSNFKNALGNVLATEENSKSDVWVAYISTLNPASFRNQEEKIHHIEMAFAILVKEGSPVVMHMGIARNPFFMVHSSVRHERISSRLHAFAAKVISATYNSPRYLLTTPLESMAKLLRNVLSKETYSEGMNKESSWIRQKANSTIIDDDFSFELYDREIKNKHKEPVLSLDYQSAHHYHWLFRKLHISLENHPYFVATLKDLSSLFPENFVTIP